MRILITGGNGQIGWELCRTLAPLGEIVAPGRSIFDLSDTKGLKQAIERLKPELIVNAAAYTAVDQAETDVDRARLVNGVAPGVLAHEAKRLGALMIHYSTDYVFDGTKGGPYIEDDTTGPLNVYGRTKLEGEQAVLGANGAAIVLRTSWIYGRRGRNFLLTMLRLGRERRTLSVVNDQHGAPTWSRLVAEATAMVVMRLAHQGRIDVDLSEQMRGIYHLTAGGVASWFEFAAAIFAEHAKQTNAGGNGISNRPEIVAVTSKQFATAAKRPSYSVLSNERMERIFGIRMPDWKAGLQLCLEK